MNNQACKVRPEIININRIEPLFYPFSIKKSKCSGSYNNINDPWAKICVTYIIKKKDLNVKVFNLMPRTNETRHINGTKHVGVNVDWMQVFVIINNIGIMINVDVNVKNWLLKVYAIKDMLGTLLIVSVNVIKHVILVSI